eukprot:UN12481
MWRRLSYQLRDRYRSINKSRPKWSFVQQPKLGEFKIRYPIALAITIPFLTTRDTQGTICTMDISTGAFATFTMLSLGIGCGIGFGLWNLYNKTKMEEIYLELHSPNGWEPYGGGVYAPPKAFKVGNVVHLKGLIKGGTPYESSVLAVLPPGWTPVDRRIFLSSLHDLVPARVDVLP